MDSKALVTTFAGVTELLHKGNVDVREGSRMLMAYIESRLAVGDFTTVNNLLGEILEKDFAVRLTSSVLRCSFRARHKLPNWQPALMEEISKPERSEYFSGLINAGNEVSTLVLEITVVNKVKNSCGMIPKEFNNISELLLALGSTRDSFLEGTVGEEREELEILFGHFAHEIVVFTYGLPINLWRSYAINPWSSISTIHFRIIPKAAADEYDFTDAYPKEKR